MRLWGVWLCLALAPTLKFRILYSDASPLLRVNSQMAPTCVVQGMYDTTVPPPNQLP